MSGNEAFLEWTRSEQFKLLSVEHAEATTASWTLMWMSAFKAGRRSMAPLVKSVWAYATGEDDPLEAIGDDEAHCEGEAFANLHRSVREACEE